MSSLSRSRIRAWTDTSRADTGSSSTSTSGSEASARAMATLWRWPPDSSKGLRLANDSSSHTSCRQVGQTVSLFAAPEAGQGEGFPDDSLDGIAGVEGAEGVLVDELDPPSLAAAGGGVKSGPTAAPQRDGPPVGGLEAQHQPSHGRLA